MRVIQIASVDESGFTLLELVCVIVVVAILAIAVLPRFFDRQIYDQRGFYDQTLSALRYAQKSAVARRRNVCVRFSTTGVAFTTASVAGNGAGCDLPLVGPTGTAPYLVTAASGVTYTNVGGATAAPNAFVFNALGQASIAQTFRVSGLTEQINVVAETGYVHR